MNEYDVIIGYADGTSETEHATEATLRDIIHRCLSYPSVERFEVIKDGYQEEARPVIARAVAGLLGVRDGGRR